MQDVSPLKLRQSLKRLGFSESETKIMVLLFHQKKLSTREISQQSMVSLSSTEYALAQLKGNGLVTVSSNGEDHYEACSEEVFLGWIEEQKQNNAEIYNQSKDEVKGFLELANEFSWKPQVMYYEGEDGYRDFMNLSLKCKSKEILFCTSMDRFRGVLSEEYDEAFYIPERIGKKIKLRLLTPKTVLTEKMQKEDSKSLRVTKFLPKDSPITSTLFVFDNVTTFISNEENPKCVMITSEEITKMVKMFFESMWQNAEQ